MAEIRWLGHNCVRIRAKEATIIADPLTNKFGFPISKQTADIVTVSHDHAGHSNLDMVKPEYKTINGPGEYEIDDVFVTGIQTWHDNEKGSKLGRNTMYLYEAEGLTFCHLGDLGHSLTADQVDEMPDIDILMIPAGSKHLSLETAAEIVALIEPKVVIPIQYRSGMGDPSLEPLEPFARAIGADIPEPEDKFAIKASELGENMRLVVLRPA